ncbi:MAG: hypothetical protein MUE74_06890 [Bacteroidales bacterium]|nr:hypothetical protein [Bacteroidales bacterium]
MTNRILYRFFVISLIILPLPQTNGSLFHISIPDTANQSFGLFDRHDLLEITLNFDLTTYLRTKPKKEYLKGKITFNPGKTDSVTRNIRIRTRGIFRNDWCFYAPIELNFKGAGFGYSDLDRINKIKLVPQCTAGNESEKYVLIEYLIYRMFNVMTDTSFKVRLLQVNYTDSENKKKPYTQFGFLIEPLKMLEARTNSVEIVSRALNQKSIYPRMMDRIAIFNYMIGNYDWAVPNQHNIKVIKPLIVDPLNLAAAVPYDFDFTGLVNAAYAIPEDKITGTTSIRERIFLGVCRDREVYRKDLEEFLRAKEEFYTLINNFAYLNAKQKKDMILYLDEFFNKCTGKQGIIEVFLDKCKNF